MPTLLEYDMNNKTVDYSFIRRMSEQWWEIAPDYFGDFYPLTPYLIEGGWLAWQFNTPETGSGFVQAFRRNIEPGEAGYSDSVWFKLRDLDPEAKYTVRNMDETGSTVQSGKDLMAKGICAKAETTPAALVFSYKRAE